MTSYPSAVLDPFVPSEWAIIKAEGDRIRAALGPLPDYMLPYWGNRIDDPRRSASFCAKQARKTPSIPWHNMGSKGCLACGAPSHA